MKNTKNHVQLIGRLGANPLMRRLDNGQHIASFSIAVTEIRQQTNGEKVKDVRWHAIVATGPLVNIVERFLHKGTEVTVDGKLFSRTFTNSQGMTREITEVVAEELYVPIKNAA